MPDNDGYPTPEELEVVRSWDWEQGFKGLVEYLQDIWWYPERHIELYWGRDRITEKSVHRLILHTGGWSGNEDIIVALKDNMMFWQLCWEKSVRGGHFYFGIRPMNWSLRVKEKE